MIQAYSLLCFNAAVALYLKRGWLEVAFVKVMNSRYRVRYLKVFIVPALISLQLQRLNRFSSGTSHSRQFLGRRHLCA